METWALILMIVLFLAIIAMVVVVYFTEKNNTATNQKNILYPFTANVNTDGTVDLKNSTGGPQIDCSEASGKNGGTINIVGAFMDIIDPYGECTGTASSVIDLTCGIPGGKVQCTTQNDCGGGMTCLGGFCIPATAKLKDAKTGTIDTDNSQCTSAGGSYCPIQPGTACVPGKDDCGDSTGQVMTCDPTSNTCVVVPGKSCYGVNTNYNTCAVFPLCSNASLKTTVVNNMCYSGPVPCMSRDASAYLAGKCDGKETCNTVWDVTDPDNGFGPLPCSMTDVSRLPVIPGQGGNFNQGYYVHGVYQCHPKDE